MQTRKRTGIPTLIKPHIHQFLHNKQDMHRQESYTEETDETAFKFEEPNVLLSNNEYIFDARSKKKYISAINYINNCHRFMNRKLSEQNCQYGDANFETEETFKFPCISNYSVVFLKLLSKNKFQVPYTNGNNSRGADNMRPKIERLHNNDSETSFHDMFKIAFKAEQANGFRKDDLLTNCVLDYNNDLNNYSLLDDYITHSKYKLDDASETKYSEASFDGFPTSLSKFKDSKEEIDALKHKIELTKSSFNVVNIEPLVNNSELTIKPPKIEHECETNENNLKKSTSGTIHVQIEETVRPTTPNKVKNMFENICQRKENRLKYPKIVASGSQTDSDSDILDDKEFEEMQKTPSFLQSNRTQLLRKKREWRSVDRTEVSSEIQDVRPNPFKLSRKDMSKLNEKMINDIGIFDKNGQLRDSVMNLLEEQRKQGLKDGKNKQFRDKRKWDIRIHLEPQDCYSDSVESSSSVAALKELFLMKCTETKGVE